MSFGYGMNENQNHLVTEGRTTSRVTNEPGGKSSVHLGWDSPEKSSELHWNLVLEWQNLRYLLQSRLAEAQTTAVVNRKDNEKQMKVVEQMKVVGSTPPTVKPEVNDVKQVARAGGTGVSSNVFAQGSRMNTGNYITDRPSSRVTQPPGGRSSISFYWKVQSIRNLSQMGREWFVIIELLFDRSVSMNYPTF